MTGKTPYVNVRYNKIKGFYMNVLNALQKQMGKKGIAISSTDDKGVHTKYFLFQIKQVDKFIISEEVTRQQDSQRSPH